MEKDTQQLTPTVARVGGPAVHSSIWTLSGDLDALAAEAFLADHLFHRDADTEWFGGNHHGHDVASVAANVRADAKVGFIESVRRDGVVTPSLGFMGSGRRPEVRAEVTHYFVAVLRPANGRQHVRVRPVNGRPCLTVGAEIAADRLFLLPAAVVNELFRPAEKLNGEPNAGRNRYAPLYALADFELTGDPG